MDPTLLYILAGCLLWTAILYYVFVVRRGQDLGAGGKSALVTITFLIVPFVGLVLWTQMQSKIRLEELGFMVYPGLGHSVGVSVGVGEQPIWLFSLNESKNAVLDFYKKAENHQGWELISESPETLVFGSGNDKVKLHVGDDNVAFILFRTGEAKPSNRLESDT